MAEMTKEEALAHMRERYPDDPQWQNFDLSAKPTEVAAETPAESGFTGPKAGSLELGASALGGAYVGRKAAGMFPAYVTPELAPNEAKLAQIELEKQRLGLTGAQTDYTLKSDALKRQSDQLTQNQLLDQAKLAEARSNYIAAKNSASPVAVVPNTQAGSLIIPADAHTRQIQGNGGVQPVTPGTGRSNQSGYEAKTKELAEHSASGQVGLKGLQSEGLVKPGGITLQFPGYTEASPTGVLGRATSKATFDRMAQDIVASNLPQEQKLAELKDLYTAAKSRAGSAATAAAGAETKLMSHLNELESTLDPFQRAVAAGEARLSGLSGQRAADAIPKSAMISRVLSKIPGALTGAGAAMSGAEAYERSQQGDQLGSWLAGLGAGVESLGVIPHPVAKGVALAGGLTSAALLTLYDMYGPEVLKVLEQKGLYSPSVMPK